MGRHHYGDRGLHPCSQNSGTHSEQGILKLACINARMWTSLDLHHTALVGISVLPRILSPLSQLLNFTTTKTTQATISVSTTPPSTKPKYNALRLTLLSTCSSMSTKCRLPQPI